jgi:hypothetical protein
MKAKDILEKILPSVRRLSKKEKMKFYTEIISETHPAFKVRKRGRIRKVTEVKQKLRRDFESAFIEEKALKVS